VISISKLRRVLLPLLALAAVAAVASGSAGAAATKGPLAALIAQSKKESGMVIYGNPPTANLQVLLDRFHYYYPWIKVTSYDLDDNTVFSKYASEAAQGVRTADVLIASAPNLWVYAARQHFAADYSPLDISLFPTWAKQFKGIYVMSPDPTIIVYNKALLGGKIPSSIADIANDSSTYSKLTGYTVDNTFGYTGLYGYVQLKGWNALQAIGTRLTPTTGVAAQLTRVANGSSLAAIITSPTARLTIKNNPAYTSIMDWSYIKDAEPIVTRGIAVTAKAGSPASARLFLNFIYTVAGQLAMCDAGFTAYRNDYTPSDGCTNTLADVYKNVGEKNVFLPGFNQKFVNARPAFTKQWHSIFG
jgi:iron(III) transport system substrate-binding protein